MGNAEVASVADRFFALPLQVLVAIVFVEVVVLGVGSRRAMTALYWRMPWKPLSYPFLLPGTVLHELAHATAAVALGLGLGQLVLFRPTRMPDGRVYFGWVIPRRQSVARQTLVAIAPLVLVPPVLLAAGLAAEALPPAQSLASGAVWILVALGSIGAFPSPGDRISIRGSAAVVAFGVLFAGVVYGLGGAAAWHAILAAIALALAIPAAVLAAALASAYVVH